MEEIKKEEEQAYTIKVRPIRPTLNIPKAIAAVEAAKSQLPNVKKKSKIRRLKKRINAIEKKIKIESKFQKR